MSPGLERLGGQGPWGPNKPSRPRRKGNIARPKEFRIRERAGVAENLAGFATTRKSRRRAGAGKRATPERRAKTRRVWPPFLALFYGTELRFACRSFAFQFGVRTWGRGYLSDTSIAPVPASARRPPIAPTTLAAASRW